MSDSGQGLRAASGLEPKDATVVGVLTQSLDAKMIFHIDTKIRMRDVAGAPAWQRLGLLREFPAQDTRERERKRPPAPGRNKWLRSFS